MTHRHVRGASFALAALALLGIGGLLSACNTVEGAGRDVSATGAAVGNAVSSGAAQTQRATGMP